MDVSRSGIEPTPPPPPPPTLSNGWVLGPGQGRQGRIEGHRLLGHEPREMPRLMQPAPEKEEGVRYERASGSAIESTDRMWRPTNSPGRDFAWVRGTPVVACPIQWSRWRLTLSRCQAWSHRTM